MLQKPVIAHVSVGSFAFDLTCSRFGGFPLIATIKADVPHFAFVPSSDLSTCSKRKHGLRWILANGRRITKSGSDGARGKSPWREAEPNDVGPGRSG